MRSISSLRFLTPIRNNWERHKISRELYRGLTISRMGNFSGRALSLHFVMLGENIIKGVCHAIPCHYYGCLKSGAVIMPLITYAAQYTEWGRSPSRIREIPLDFPPYRRVLVGGNPAICAHLNEGGGNFSVFRTLRVFRDHLMDEVKKIIYE